MPWKKGENQIICLRRFFKRFPVSGGEYSYQNFLQHLCSENCLLKNKYSNYVQELSRKKSWILVQYLYTFISNCRDYSIFAWTLFGNVVNIYKICFFAEMEKVPYGKRPIGFNLEITFSQEEGRGQSILRHPLKISSRMWSAAFSLFQHIEFTDRR